MIFLKLYSNSKKISNIVKIQLTNTKIQNYIMTYFLLKHLVSHLKSPNVNYKKFRNKLGIIIPTDCMLCLKSNYILQNQILHYFSYILAYRAYPFKEALFKLNDHKLSIFFIKLPNNLRTLPLEEINSGDAINFKLDIVGSFSYIEYIYLLNIFGFIGLLASIDDCGLEMDALMDKNKNRININLDAILFNNAIV